MKKPLIASIALALVAGVVLTSCEGERDGREENTERVAITTDRAPEAIGPYSQAIRRGDMLFLAGQIGLDPDTGELVDGGLKPEARQAMDNLQAVLEEAGFTMGEVVETQVFLADMDDFSDFNDVYAEYFEAAPPARAVVEVSRIPLDARVEIKMTAVK